MRIFLSILSLLCNITTNNYATQSIPVPITEETEKFIRNADSKDISYVLDAIERNPELLRAQDRMGYTALHRAIIRNNLDMAKILIIEIQERYQVLDLHKQPQHPLNIQDFEGNTALDIALNKGHTDLVELCKAQANANSTKNNHELSAKLPLNLSANNYTIAQIKTISAQCNNSNNNNLNTAAGSPYLINNTHINSTHAPEHALEHTLEKDTKTNEQRLLKALRENNSIYLQEQLQKSTPIDTQTPLGSTLLHKAVMAGHEPLVRFLLDQGADPNQKNSSGLTPLRYAMGRYSGESCESLVTLLLNKGADYTLTDNYGQTALSAAQEYANWLTSRGHAYTLVGRHIDLLKRYIHLVEQTQQNPNREILQEAIKHNFARIVQVLLESGITLTNDDLTLAKQHNASDVLAVLQNY